MSDLPVLTTDGIDSKLSEGGEGLPPGWVDTTLRELTDHKSGNSKLIKGKLSPIQTEKYKFPGFSASGQDIWLDICEQKGPAVIVSAVGARCGKTFISSGCFNAIANTHVVKPIKDALDVRFLWYLTNDEEFWVKGGSAQPFVKVGATFERGFALPPLPEQIRIADKLDALLARVDAGRERLERVPKLLKRFRQSVLSAAVSGELTREWRGGGDTKWEETTIESVCDKIVDCPHSTPKWSESGRICVRTSDFKPNKLNLSTSRCVSDEIFAERTSRLTPKPGDILYSREGAILGIACIIPDDVELCMGQRMMLMRTSPKYLSKLLMYSLNCEPILQIVQGSTGGSASPHINVGDVKKFPIPLPSLPEQAEIVRRVESLFAIADRIEQRYASALASFGRLTPALLAKAFRGELVPQDPNDEPASVLLERIRAQRAEGGSHRAKGGTPRAAGDGAEPKRRGRPPKAQTEADADMPKGRGRPPKVRSAAAPIPEASSYEDAVRRLEAQKLERAQGSRQVGLFEEAEGTT